MDATNVVTSTDTVGIGYHRWEQLVHPKAIIIMEDDHHALDTLKINVMTGEATADPMLGCTQETKAQVTQDTPAQTDTPAGTGTQDEGSCQTATELKADHPTDSGQVAIDHRLPTLGIILEADHPHAAMRNHIDIVSPYKTILRITKTKITTTQMTTSRKI